MMADTVRLHGLRVPLAGLHTPTSNDGSVASCLDAYIPLYTFVACQSEARATKLARVDSMPAVPDISEQRCDSPPPPYGLAPFGLGSVILDDHNCAAAGFNDLPLAIPTRICSLSEPLWWHQDIATPGPAIADPDSVPDVYDKGVISRVPTAARTLPRRNASGVFRSRLGTRRGSGGAVATAAAEVPERSVLEVNLMSLWEDRADRGLFRYDVTQCPTRVLPYGRGFVAQLNEGRATKKRPTEFGTDRVLQPYNPHKFNFTKAALREALMAFFPLYGTSHRTKTSSPWRTAIGDDLLAVDTAPTAPLVVPPTASLREAVGGGGNSPHLVLINVSPIDYGHVLLVPRVLDELPQALSTEVVLLALQFSRELSSSHHRVGYNSLGAFATINHLHFHSYYLPLPLPCESAATAPLPGGSGGLAGPRDGTEAMGVLPASSLSSSSAAPGCKRGRSVVGGGPDGRGGCGVHVSRLVDYPVNGFVVAADFRGGGGSEASWGTQVDAYGESDPLEALAAVVGRAAERMQAANQPFNLLVTDRGQRVFVFPQCYAERQAAGAVPAELLDTGVNPAAFEIAGHLVLKRAEDFEAASEAWATRLLSQVSVPEERFMDVARMCFGGDGDDHQQTRNAAGLVCA